MCPRVFGLLKELCLKLLFLGFSLTSQYLFKQITQAVQCFLDGEWRLPVNIFLAGQDSQQTSGVWKEEKKKSKAHPLLSKQVFFNNSMYISL